jgi:hypothetical protein
VREAIPRTVLLSLPVPMRLCFVSSPRRGSDSCLMRIPVLDPGFGLRSYLHPEDPDNIMASLVVSRVGKILGRQA